jgi:tryptophanyl-tRNA synthetase
VLKKGTEKAEAKAAATLSEVKKAMRIDYFEDQEWLDSQIRKFETRQ